MKGYLHSSNIPNVADKLNKLPLLPYSVKYEDGKYA